MIHFFPICKLGLHIIVTILNLYFQSLEYAKKQNYLQSLFGEVLTISLKETQVADNLSWINECMARLFVHSRIYQCSRFFGADVMKTMTVTCPGGCGVRRHKKITWKHSRKKLLEEDAQINLWRIIINFSSATNYLLNIIYSYQTLS